MCVLLLAVVAGRQMMELSLGWGMHEQLESSRLPLVSPEQAEDHCFSGI